LQGDGAIGTLQQGGKTSRGRPAEKSKEKPGCHDQGPLPQNTQLRVDFQTNRTMMEKKVMCRLHTSEQERNCRKKDIRTGLSTLKEMGVNESGKEGYSQEVEGEPGFGG